MTTSIPRSGTLADERFARLRAEAALFMRDHVLSLVSHDFRSPLNAIHSWAYVLERKLNTDDAAAQRALAGIRSGVDQQVKLLEDAVDSTRAQTKTLSLERSLFVLEPLIDEGVAQVRGAFADARHVSLVIDAQLEEKSLDGDRERLSQALWAILMFAVEASVANGVVRVRSVIEGGNWQVDVSHAVSFAALADAELAHVFEPFALRQAMQPRDAGRIAWVFALPQRVGTAHGGAFAQGDLMDGTTVTHTLRVPLTA